VDIPYSSFFVSKIHSYSTVFHTLIHIVIHTYQPSLLHPKEKEFLKCIAFSDFLCIFAHKIKQYEEGIIADAGRHFLGNYI
jgi:hypothetical protein